MGSSVPEPVSGARVDAALGLLRERGERLTLARRAVLEVLDGTTEHLGADEIVTRVGERAQGVHRATVYRTLSALVESGLVTHTHVGGAATVYHLAVEADSDARDRHAHVQCTSCGAVLDVPSDALDPVAAWLRRELGFRLDPEHAALLGTCSGCRAEAGGRAAQ